MVIETVCTCGHVFWQGVMAALVPSMGVLLYLLWNAPVDKDEDRR